MKSERFKRSPGYFLINENTNIRYAVILRGNLKEITIGIVLGENAISTLVLPALDLYRVVRSMAIRVQPPIDREAERRLGAPLLASSGTVWATRADCGGFDISVTPMHGDVAGAVYFPESAIEELYAVVTALVSLREIEVHNGE